MEAIDIRDYAQRAYDADPNNRNRTSLKAARSTLKVLVRNAKETWTNDLIDSANTGRGADGKLDSKAVWMAVKQLKAGLSTFSPAVTIKLKKPNGEFCTTDAENAEVFAGHFGKVLNIDTPFSTTPCLRSLSNAPYEAISTTLRI